MDCADLAIPGADPSDDVAPVVVESSDAEVAEALTFFADRKAEETSKQVERARTQSRVFSVMQYHRHPETDTVMLTQQQVDDGLRILAPDRYAYIWHPYDRIVEVDEGTGEPTCTGLKGMHCHLVLWFTEDRPTIRTVSDALTIPSARVKPPNEEDVKRSGRGAAEKAFFDLVEYLTHESRAKDAIPGVTQPERWYLIDKDQDTKPGKYQYGRGRVVANFDYSSALDRHMAGRVSAAEGGKSLRERRRKLRRAVMEGLTLREAREADPDVYADDLPRLKTLRGDFLTTLNAPESVINFYIFGEGGTGKDLLAKGLARSLAPEVARPYFKVGGDNVSFEGYDGQPVVIWEDMRVADMVSAARGRGSLFNILGPWRESDPEDAPVVNIKNSKTQLLNRVNIVTGPQHYDAFLRGLAGEYQAYRGGQLVQFEAENLNQGFRRFPVIIPVSEREFSIYVNVGVMEGSRDYLSYIKHERMRQDLETLVRRCKRISDEAERERVHRELEAQTVAPIVEQYHALVGPDGDELTADEVRAELADVGQPIPGAREQEDRQRVEEQIARLEKENAERRRALQLQAEAAQQRAEEQRLRELCICPSPPGNSIWGRHEVIDCPAQPPEVIERRRAEEEERRARRLAEIRENGLVLTPTTGR